MIRKAVCCICLTVCLATTSNADIVAYDNNAGGAVGINTAFESDSGTGIIAADDVTFATTTTITGVQWTGRYAFIDTPQAIDDFTISFYSDSGAMPGSLITSFSVGNAVNRVDSGFNLFDLNIYEYSASVDFTMISGTNYWLSITNDTSTDTDDNFQWGSDSGVGNSYASFNGGTSWSSIADQHDFRLTVIPEPGSFSLAAGLFCLIAIQRRKRR